MVTLVNFLCLLSGRQRKPGKNCVTSFRVKPFDAHAQKLDRWYCLKSLEQKVEENSCESDFFLPHLLLLWFLIWTRMIRQSCCHDFASEVFDMKSDMNVNLKRNYCWWLSHSIHQYKLQDCKTSLRITSTSCLVTSSAVFISLKSIVSFCHWLVSSWFDSWSLNGICNDFSIRPNNFWKWNTKDASIRTNSTIFAGVSETGCISYSCSPLFTLQWIWSRCLCFNANEIWWEDWFPWRNSRRSLSINCRDCSSTESRTNGGD